mmetsp:Transcript_136706/g.424700  ORF Transcript_136706/g.424700 Transcript_136706/m.424700 type:complete len:399 (+) Transcript_136706:1753-2949(+)
MPPRGLRARAHALGGAPAGRLRELLARGHERGLHGEAQAHCSGGGELRAHARPRRGARRHGGRLLRVRWRRHRRGRPHPLAALAQRPVPLRHPGNPFGQPAGADAEVRRGADAAADPGLSVHLLLPCADHHEARLGPAHGRARGLRCELPPGRLPHGGTLPTLAQGGLVPLARPRVHLGVLRAHGGHGRHAHARGRVGPRTEGPGPQLRRPAGLRRLPHPGPRDEAGAAPRHDGRGVDAAPRAPDHLLLPRRRVAGQRGRLGDRRGHGHGRRAGLHPPRGPQEGHGPGGRDQRLSRRGGGRPGGAPRREECGGCRCAAPGPRQRVVRRGAHGRRGHHHGESAGVPSGAPGRGQGAEGLPLLGRARARRGRQGQAIRARRLGGLAARGGWAPPAGRTRR